MRRGICKMARMGIVLFIAAFMLTSCAKKPQDISQEENEDNLVYSAQYYPVFDYVSNVISAFDYEKNEVIFNCRTDEDYKSNRSLMGVNLDDMQLSEIADKTDVRRSRVRQKEKAAFDIHDRVNYAVTDSKLKIDEEKSVIALNLQIDENICSMYDYFEIFLDRMMFCRKSAEILGTTFKLTVNGRKVL